MARKVSFRIPCSPRPRPELSVDEARAHFSVPAPVAHTGSRFLDCGSGSPGECPELHTGLRPGTVAGRTGLDIQLSISRCV
jgi:hypothetical protein